ncbi:MAG TPA: F0F1 ATP synthase subunit epsilon [Polyangiaceae bacterium]|jgi:F-type H+-transporting ATPase subunit epsilon|nr:F0F1 ATP synthase subunit epsilon [Polyangiaceae bacterium]
MADGTSLKLEIVTPTGVAVSQNVAELTAPGVDGEIGLLPGHVALLAAIVTGTVSLKPVGGTADDTTKYAVAHGVLEVANDKALLLTEKCAKKDDVDIVATRARLKEVGEELAAFQGDLDDTGRIALIEEEQWLASLLELIGDPPPPTTRERTRFQPKQIDDVVIEEGSEEAAPTESDDAA